MGSQQGLQMRHVVVGIRIGLGLAQFDALLQTTVTELVVKHHIPVAHQSGNDSQTGGITTAEHQGIGGAFPPSQLLFQLTMEGTMAAQPTGTRAAHPIFLHRLNRRLHQAGVTGQPQVVITGKVQNPLRS
jgi:hypothetical protein